MPAHAANLNTTCDAAHVPAVINSLAAHVAILDELGVVLAVNDSWRRFALANGYRGDGFGVGEPYLGVCDKAAAQGDPDACEVSRGLRELIAARAEEFRHDYRCDLPSGPRWYQLRVTPYLENGCKRFIAVHEDVTEVRRAVETARTTAQRLETVLEAAPIVLFVIDREGLFRLSCGRGLALLGLADHQIEGKSIYELYADAPELIALLKRAIGGEAFSATVPLAGRVWEARYAPLIGADGACEGTIGAAIDATERYRAEQELARYRDHLESLVAERTAALERSHEQLAQADRLASIGTLAAGVGHDLGNLLLPMRCRLDALDAADIGPQLKLEVASIRQALDLLQELSNGLRLCALDPAKASGEKQVTELLQWWREVGHMMARVVPGRIKFEIQFPDRPVRIAIAPHQLSQAVLNLIVNATEAIPERGDIRLRAELDTAGQFITIAVADTGAGMPPEVRRHAFEPFFTTKKRARSTGLGLSVVHSAVRLAHGIVGIDSSPGRGTTVSMILPVLQMRTTEPSSRASSSRDAPRVAISISDARRAALLMHVLRASGFAPFQGDPLPEAVPSIWIVEATDAHLPKVHDFITRQGATNVIVFGEIPPSWDALGLSSIDETRGLDGIREALRLASVAQRFLA